MILKPRRNGRRIEANLVLNGTTPTLVLADAVIIGPKSTLLDHFVLVEATPAELWALRNAGFIVTTSLEFLKEPPQPPPPNDDDPFS